MKRLLPHRAIRLGSRACMILLLAVSSAALGDGDIGETKPPTPQEQQDFAAKLARIAAHNAQVPEGGTIADAITSLSAPVVIQFDCPDSAPVNQVNITITTQHRRWDRTLAEKITGVTGIVGAYLWNIAAPTIKDGKKSYVATNVVMLDPAVTTPQEQSVPLGQLGDETLLYHELLHGQLLINAMRNDEAWQNNVCQCNAPDLTPIDAGHETIHGLEETYMQNVAGEDNTVHVVRPPAQMAEDADGNFEINLGTEDDLLGDKESVTIEYYFPSGSNINEASLQVVFENGRVIVRGTLTDATQVGFFLVHIDPPTDWVFTGVEIGIVILPVNAIPTVSQWGLIVLALLLLTMGTIVFGRRRRPAVA